MGIVVEAAGFTISLLSPAAKGATPAATHVIRHKSGGGSMASGLTFDAAEQQMLQELARDASDPTGAVVSRSRLPPGVVSSTTLTAGPAVRTTPGQLPDGTAVMRVGGSIAAPRKIRDVLPVYPESASAAGLSGEVVLEVTIDAAGAVASVTPIGGHPALAAAASDAVRQWRYEPTSVNGAAVAVVMTVRVPVR
jgi:TonB family protein